MKPVFPAAKLLVLISATLPQKLLGLIPLHEEYTINRIIVPSKFNDEVYFVPAKMSWNEHGEGYVPSAKWLPILYNMVEKYYDEGYSVGVASRSYSLTRTLTAELVSRGFKVYSDTRDRAPPRYEDASGRYVIIWTTRGRWYRGISLPDTDVIIATYQAFLGPVDNFTLFLAEEEEVEYARLMNYAVNTQSYFRTNRRRNMSHKLILFDLRAYHAMRVAFSEFVTTSWYRRITHATPLHVF
jgi:hypothetical protein